MKKMYTSIILSLLMMGVCYSQGSSKSNKCLNFNGQTSDISFVDNDFKLHTGSSMTVTAWIKWNSMTNAPSWTNMVTLNSTTNNGDVGQFWLQHDQTNSKFEFAVQTVKNRTFVQSTIVPQVGLWYHLAGVYDGSTLCLYVNGVLQGKTSLNGNINTYKSDFKLNIGKWASPSSAYRRFNGDIDEVALWNISLSQTQIRETMCQSLNGSESGLMGYWPMDNTNANILYDFTPNLRNATIVSSSLIESGAAVGKQSSYTYGGAKLSLVHPVNKDSLVIENFSAAVTGFHLYRVDSSLNVKTPPIGFKNIIPYYYGVFIVNASGQTYQTTYYYSGHPNVNASSILGLAGRTMESDLVWNSLKVTQNASIKLLSLSATGQTGRNNYIVGELDDALPVSFINFAAFQKDDYVRLEWSTVNEYGNIFYTIEKSNDGIHFEILDSVYGLGNSIGIQKYTFDDNSLPEVTAFYRIGQKEENIDNFTYTKIILIKSTGFDSDEITAYPNPFQDKVTMSFVANVETTFVIHLMTLDGVVVFQNSLAASKGFNSYCLEQISDLNEGIYIMIVSDDIGLTKQLRIVKQ